MDTKTEQPIEENYSHEYTTVSHKLNINRNQTNTNAFIKIYGNNVADWMNRALF